MRHETDMDMHVHIHNDPVIMQLLNRVDRFEQDLKEIKAGIQTLERLHGHNTEAIETLGALRVRIAAKSLELKTVLHITEGEPE